MNQKFSKKYTYNFKNKYYIISKIKKISNQCKNGCKIIVDNEYINIEAYNNNTILLAYELIKNELKLLNNNNVNKPIEKKNETPSNKFSLLENDSVVDYVFHTNNNSNEYIYKINKKIEKKDKLLEILNNNNVSKEEIESNKIALELLKEEEQIKNKKLKRQRNRQRRKEKLRKDNSH